MTHSWEKRAEYKLSADCRLCGLTRFTQIYDDYGRGRRVTSTYYRGKKFMGRKVPICGADVGYKSQVKPRAVLPPLKPRTAFQHLMEED